MVFILIPLCFWVGWFFMECLKDKSKLSTEEKKELFALNLGVAITSFVWFISNLLYYLLS